MRYVLEGLDCAMCALKLEKELQKIKGMEEATVNFASRSLEIPAEMVEAARRVIKDVEPGVKLLEPDKGSSFSAERTEDEKRKLYTIIGAGLLLALGLIFNQYFYPTSYAWVGYVTLLASYLMVGWPVIGAAYHNLTRRRLFDEKVLICLATVGAIAIRQLPEAVAVMVLYTLGEYLQDRAVNRSRRSIRGLLEVRPEYANLKADGEIKRVRPEEVQEGQLIVVKPGEKIPLDGEVVEGRSLLNTSILTGESVPLGVGPGEKVLSGMVNLDGLLTVRVTKPYSDSTVSRLLALVENASERKAPTELFITTFARYYTPAVVIGALAIAVVPPLVISGAVFSEWIYRALVLLVISCPCALVISIPLSYFGGLGAASRHGILIKGANFLEALAHLDTVVFDKTGTLTDGVFGVNRVVTAHGFSEAEILCLAAHAEYFSTHPVARLLRETCENNVQVERIEAFEECAGHGVKAVVDGKKVLVGSDGLLYQEGMASKELPRLGDSGVHVVVDGVYAGYILIEDGIKPDAPKAIARLKELGVRRTVMLTGDQEAAAERVASALMLDGYYARLLPQDKVARVEELIEALGDRGRSKLAFVGDGINDAPVIARADVGVAMGGLGSDAAIEAADVVLMEDRPSRLAIAVEIARYTCKIVRQNLVLTLGVKLFFLGLGVGGIATIWEAVFADVGVALVAVLNALRPLWYKPELSREKARLSAKLEAHPGCVPLFR